MDKDRSKLDNIKSFYIMKSIYNTLSRSVFLEFIYYNKTIQNKFYINIEDYKNFGKRTKIIETNGSGKEYKIKFEGEYLNGKKNGKGKEYYENGKIKYEGEYINGERNGKGKEYYRNGKLFFEGEYLDGKRHGKGKEYNEEGLLLFEGGYEYGWKS